MRQTRRRERGADGSAASKPPARCDCLALLLNNLRLQTLGTIRRIDSSHVRVKGLRGVLVVVALPGDLDAHSARHALDSLCARSQQTKEPNHKERKYNHISDTSKPRRPSPFIHLPSHSACADRNIATCLTLKGNVETYPRPDGLVQLHIKAHIISLHRLLREGPDGLHRLGSTLLEGPENVQELVISMEGIDRNERRLC